MELQTTLKAKIDLTQLPPELIHVSVINELATLWEGYMRDRQALDAVGVFWHEEQITKILNQYSNKE